jgi:predicted nucleotide-binding protein
MASPPLNRTSVFISYSHKDAKFLDQLVEHLAYFERNNLLKVWSDKNITPGAQWREKIKQAIESTSVAVLLISPSFLASKFIAENELPPLLRAAEKEGAIILPVIVRSSYFEDTELANFQALNNPSKPVARMKGYERDALWTNVVREIRKAIAPQQQSSTAISNQQAEADVLIQTSLQTTSPISTRIEEQIVQRWQENSSVIVSQAGEDVVVPLSQAQNNGDRSGLTVQQVKSAWENVIKRTRQKSSGTLSAMLRLFTILDVEGTAKQPVVVIQSEKQAHYKYVKEEERYKILEWALTIEFGLDCRVRLLAPDTVQREEILPTLTVQQVEDAWENVVKRTRQKSSGTLAAMLRLSKILYVEGTSEQPIIVIQPVKKVHYSHLSEEDKCKVLEWALTIEFGLDCKVRYVSPE